MAVAAEPDSVFNPSSVWSQVDGRKRETGAPALLDGERAKSEHHLHRRDRRAVRRARRGERGERQIKAEISCRCKAWLKRRPRAGSRRHEHAVPADQAVRRRFDKRIYIPLPDEKRAHVQGARRGHATTTDAHSILGAGGEGFSGSTSTTREGCAVRTGAQSAGGDTFKTVPYEGAETNANDKSKQRYVPVLRRPRCVGVIAGTAGGSGTLGW